MVTVALDFLGVRANRMIGYVLTHNTLAAPVSPPPALGVVPEEVDDDVDLINLAILYRVLWEVGVLLSIFKG